MTKSEFENVCREAFELFRSFEPTDTGNMKFNATALTIDGLVGEIRIDVAVAPYAGYTNIPWSATSPFWANSTKYPHLNGVRVSSLYDTPDTAKKNPNEGWIDIAVKAMAELIANRLGGKLK